MISHYVSSYQYYFHHKTCESCTSTATATVVTSFTSVGLPGVPGQQDELPPMPLILMDTMRGVGIAAFAAATSISDGSTGQIACFTQAYYVNFPI